MTQPVRINECGNRVRDCPAAPRELIMRNNVVALLLFVFTLFACPSAVRAQDETAADADRLNKQVIELYRQGKYADAIPIAQHVAEIRKRVQGEENPDYATILNNLALLYENTGHYERAEPLYKQALEIRKRVLGEDHPLYAMSLNNLAGLYYHKAQYEKAEPLFKQALEIQKRVLGEESPDYANGLNNLAELYATMGQFQKAEPLYKQALETRKRVSGENSSDYATSLDNLAVLYEQMGQFEKAEPLLRQALEIRKRVLGEDHPDYAGSLNNLASFYEHMGRYEKSELLYKQALEIRKRLLGEDHPLYATSLNNLAGVYFHTGQYEKAEPLCKQALEIQKRVVGEDHPDYALGLDNLASLYDDMGQYEKAEPLRRQALEIRKRVLGEDHPLYAMSLNNLGSLYENMGQYEKAEVFYKQALETWKRVEDLPDYAMSLNNLASLYVHMGQYEKAELLYKQALEIRKRVLGEDHPDYALSLNNLAELYETMGQFQKAEPLLRQSLEIGKRALGEDNPSYAASLNNLGSLYANMGQYAKAEPLFRQGLEIQKRTLGEDHPQYATSASNLAELYATMGQFQKAEPLLRQALEIRKRVLGEDHPDYAISLNNLAELYYRISQYEKVEPLLLQALTIQKRALGEGHPDYALGLNNLASFYEHMGRYDKAEPLFRQALEIQKRTLGEDHPNYASSLSGLACLLAATGRTAQALDVLARAAQVEQNNLEQIFGFTSQAGMRDYLAKTNGTVEMLVGLAGQSDDPRAVQLALTWTLRRKGIILDTLARFRQAQYLSERDPVVAERVAQVRGLEQHLHALAFEPSKGAGAAAQERERSAVQEQLNQVEGELNRKLGAHNPERTTGNIDAIAVRQRLPKGSVLVEFLLVHPVDFKATGKKLQWQPARYFAFVISSDLKATPRLIDLGGAEEIDRLINHVRENIESFAKLNDDKRWEEEEKGEEAAYQQVSARLYDALFRRTGLREALGSARTIYISPDGELNRIAFEALVDDESSRQEEDEKRSRYLVENYNFVYLPAGRDLLRPESKLGQGTVVFAGPDYDLGANQRESEAHVLLAKSDNARVPIMRGAATRDIRGIRWDPLKGAAEEANDVKRSLEGTKYGPVELYDGKEALEEVFLSVHSPRILHVATHGYFLRHEELDPEDRESLMRGDDSVEFGAARGLGRLRGAEDPLLRSGLVFAGANLMGASDGTTEDVGDGWVTAEDVSQMDLQGTDLAVLSACETGLGDVKVGDGVQGLQRAFLLAGARSLIMSLYSVPDAESRELMRDFYGSLKAGKTKAAALHEAELKMIRERRTKGGAAHPFFWASFVLVGEPN